MARDELEQTERAGVGRVEILEHDHERPAGGGALQERCDRIEQPEARLLLVGQRHGRLEFAEDLGHLWHDLGNRGGTRA